MTYDVKKGFRGFLGLLALLGVLGVSPPAWAQCDVRCQEAAPAEAKPAPRQEPARASKPIPGHRVSALTYRRTLPRPPARHTTRKPVAEPRPEGAAPVLASEQVLLAQAESPPVDEGLPVRSVQTESYRTEPPVRLGAIPETLPPVAAVIDQPVGSLWAEVPTWAVALGCDAALLSLLFLVVRATRVRRQRRPVS